MKTKRDTLDYSYHHVKKRLKERYDLDISRLEYDRLNSIVPKSFVYKVEEDAEEKQYLYKFFFKEKEVIFVYSKERERIKTVLPPVA